jgi:hypothetical protein
MSDLEGFLAVTKMVANGTMPHKRFGRSLRIPWAWLLAQVEEAQGNS